MEPHQTTRRHSLVRASLIATGALTVLVAAIVLAGTIADHLPPAQTTIVGFVAVCVLIVMVAAREEGR